MISKFHRGSSTFACNVCGRTTRDTGVQSAGNKICPQCFELAGIENEISDGYTTVAAEAKKISELIEQIVAKNGDTTEWVKTFITKA